ncbi:sensor histidine kinase [Acetatifactor aquisgranensis]|uniref:sensor histidine kinase n=1 Tax=Acetatifactor aquisgranensis TaxID=2941233 RepID=UPI00203B0502|nr:HAMP domain-containing sensor histidine kinase [Acetatifactor aquisgranensis]
MRLGRKNLFYSMALAGIMLIFLVGYFIYMLPSLYVDYVMEENLKSIRRQHEAYVEQGSYEGVSVRNSTACISLEIPLEEDYVLVTGKAFSAEITFHDERMNQILDRCRELLFLADAEEDGDLREEMGRFGDILEEVVQEDSSLPVSLNFRYLQDMEEEFYNESVKIHTYSDNLFITELSVEDASNRYTNYIAFEKTEERMIMSVLPVVAPDVDEIRPVVLQSLPMLGAVIFLLVLLSSRLYSKGIVSPVMELVRHTEEMKYDRNFSVKRLSEKRPDTGDEIQELADTLDDLYQQIKEGYCQLEEKNRELAEENRRQEIFLRASSHQLKTPIAAALLLVDGMLNEIGRYKDTKVYLPRVKEQLLSMRKMVEDILYLNHCAEDMRIRQTDVGKLLEERLRSCQVALADKGIAVDVPENMVFAAKTDEMIISQILDNLLSNAVRYTPEGGHIRIAYLEAGGCGRRILIENFGVTIPEELAPHILEPFVSGSHQADSSGMRSHGLGLYIASYYAKKLGILLEVRNGEDSVAAELTFLPEYQKS